jgi:hypothetical protein
MLRFSRVIKARLAAFASMALTAALGACEPNPGAPSAGACLPLAPMELLERHGEQWETMARLGGDGLIFERKQPNPVMRIAGDGIVNPAGDVLARCEGDRTLTKLGLRFDEHDALLEPTTGHRIYVHDSGEVEAAFNGPAHVFPWHVNGSTRATRRTAELLVLVAVLSMHFHAY